METSLDVHREARGRRLGSALDDVLLDRLASDGFHTALGLIALPNDPSVRLHERAGFETVGTHKRLGKLDDAWRDVLLLERRSPSVD